MNDASAAPAVKPKHSELSRRIAAGLVLACAAIGIVYAGGWLYFAAVLVVSAIAVIELSGLLSAYVRYPMLLRSIGLLSLAVVAFAQVFAGTSVALIVVAAFAVLGGTVAGPRTSDRLVFALGVAGAGLFFIALLWLRGGDAVGRASIYWLFAVVWGTDIGAYAVGRTLGGAKLAPRISPNKTWSGAIGGLASAIGGALLLGWLMAAVGWAREMPDLLVLLGLGASLSVISQGGDLVESMLKRAAGKKDSGTLIPGHGGVLDRLDGFIPAAMALAFISWLAGAGRLPWAAVG